MDNSAGCATAIYGTLLAGGVFVVVNPQTKEDKLLYVLDDCEAAAVLTEGSLTRTALAAAASAPSVKAVVADSARRASRRPEARRRDRERRARAARARHDPARPGGAHLHVGEHRLPKGVMMTHQSMVFAAGRSRSTCGSGPTSASSACCRSRSTTASTSSS